MLPSHPRELFRLCPTLDRYAYTAVCHVFNRRMAFSEEYRESGMEPYQDNGMWFYKYEKK